MRPDRSWDYVKSVIRVAYLGVCLCLFCGNLDWTEATVWGLFAILEGANYWWESRE